MPRRTVGARLVKWNGATVADSVRSAEVEAVQETIIAAAEMAAGMRSGRAADIEAATAEVDGGTVTGRWGVFPEPHGEDMFWEMFVELGNGVQAGDNAKRRAADAQYPKLADRLRSHRGG